MIKESFFYKLEAAGNDFVLIEKQKVKIRNQELKSFAKKYCLRRRGVGADGLLVIERSKKADFRMRIFNPDGSEPEMCGNGARCSAFWASLKLKKKKIDLETKAGVIEAEVSRKNNWGNVKIKLSDPFALKLNTPIRVFGREIKTNFINTGVPHVVIFVQGLEKINLGEIGRKIRFHRIFSPAGTNVNFVEILENDFLSLRTYERGVEEETLACGTGAVASAIITNYKLQTVNDRQKMKVLTKSGEILKVYFKRRGKAVKDTWLEGRTNLVYRGELRGE